MWAKNKIQNGFTIVELLIVIVVIGILAAITIVAYNGVQSRAYDTTVQADLRNFHSIIAQQKALNGTYPATLTTSMGFKFSRGAYGLDFQGLNVRYCYNSTADNYIIYALSKSGNYFRYVSDSGGSVATNTYGWGICSQIGLVNTNPSQNGLSNATWDTSWVN